MTVSDKQNFSKLFKENYVFSDISFCFYQLFLSITASRKLTNNLNLEMLHYHKSCHFLKNNNLNVLK